MSKKIYELVKQAQKTSKRDDNMFLTTMNFSTLDRYSELLLASFVSKQMDVDSYMKYLRSEVYIEGVENPI